MLLDVTPESGPDAFLVRGAELFIKQAVVILKREFGINDNLAERLGREQNTVCYRSVRQMNLSRIAGIIDTEDGLHQRIEFNLPVGSPGLLVGQHILKAGDAGGQVLQALLGFINARHLLLDGGERLVGLLKSFQKAVIDTGLNPVQAAGCGFVQAVQVAADGFAHSVLEIHHLLGDLCTELVHLVILRLFTFIQHLPDGDLLFQIGMVHHKNNDDHCRQKDNCK